MHELESDVWLSQKGGNKGPLLHWECFKPVLTNNEMHGSFPNMYIRLRIYLSILVKNFSGERFFCSETY